MKLAWAMVAFGLTMCSTFQTAMALDPTQRISQYAHTAWRVQDGYFEAQPTSIAQTADGYVWVGTESGLVRFDGVRFVPTSSSPDQLAATASIYSLLATRDGGLWIGAGSGLVHWKNRSFVNQIAANGRIESMIEDGRGEVWAVRGRVRDESGPLCRVESASLKCYGKADGIETPYAEGLASDTNGNLWIGTTDRLIRWKPKDTTTYKLKGLESSEDLTGIDSIVASEDGSLWVGIDPSGPGLGLQHFHDGTWENFVAPTLQGSTLDVSALLLDREGSLWVGTMSHGLYRIHDHSVDHYQGTDGLSGDTVKRILQDAEGNVWVATSMGVDCFRDLAIISYSKSEGLTSENVSSVTSSPDGALWMGNIGALESLRNGESHAILDGKGLPGHSVTSLLNDHAGKLWVGIDNRLFIYDGREFVEVIRPDGKATGVITALVEDTDENIWANTLGPEKGLIEIKEKRIIREFRSPEFQRTSSLAPDPKGGIWISSFNGGLLRFRDSRIETIPIPKTAEIGNIDRLFVDPSGMLWGGTLNGVLRWDGKTFTTLNYRNGLPCKQIFSMLFDNAHSLWLSGKCGIVTIDDSELQRWIEDPKTKVKFRQFDTFDGAHPAYASFSPSATRSSDGRLWIATESILQMIDPTHLHFNAIVPPVHIEGITADGHSDWPMHNLKLPALTHDIQIDYTALSFVMPRRVRFRYKLDGHDKEWKDAGVRRSMFYTNLTPGAYTFHVIACNNNGVWNTRGDLLSFSIAPAWYQTVWIRFVYVALGTGLLYAFYLFRVNQYEQSFRVRLDERLEERTRLARDLHDTLLQTIQASKIVADEALDHYTDPVKSQKLLQRLSTWLGQATQEGRHALHSLRTSVLADSDLLGPLRLALEECRNSSSIEPIHRVIGKSRELHPLVRDEVYLIGYEAIRNACFHSHGTRLDIELEYGENFILRVRDNGCIANAELLRVGKQGHFGLAGMRERAIRIGAKLTIQRSSDNGTEVILVVPGNVLYKIPMTNRFSQALRYLGIRR